jgi:hypothetical protein
VVDGLNFISDRGVATFVKERSIFRASHFQSPNQWLSLVHREVAVIATFDTASSLAAKAATAMIPIVFSMGADPVKIGLVNNLARPDGNVTGMSHLINALSSKRLGLLRDNTLGLTIPPGILAIADEVIE